MSRQLAFDLATQASLGREDFVVTPANALALAQIDGWRDWPGGRMLLCGPSGSGKSHLAAIWAAEAGARVIAASALDAADLPELAAAGAVAVENSETVAGRPEAETALFHLHNLLSGSGRLLVTAAAPPRDWGLALPDLLSRLQAMPLLRLAPPDDALLAAVLAKLFAERQMEVSPTMIPWLVARMPRSIAAARRIAAALNVRALAERRAITPHLAAGVLDTSADE